MFQMNHLQRAFLSDSAIQLYAHLLGIRVDTALPEPTLRRYRRQAARAGVRGRRRSRAIPCTVRSLAEWRMKARV